MKLFTKYNRVNILATIATFIIGGVAFYAVLYYVLQHQLDDTLRGEQQEISDYVRAHGQLPEIQNTRHQWTIVENTGGAEVQRRFGSVIRHDVRDGDDDVIRQLTFPIRIGEANYAITVNRSEGETEDLLKLIIMVTLAMIGLILLVNYFINRMLINRLWQPFYNTIDGIRNYRVAFEKPLQLPKENIDEFTLLNDSLSAMTARIYKEYEALKSFTENASHEMQTPLAVINGKIELLLQNDALNGQGIQQLLAIEQATKKLARLHQSLLLLAKLENRQFVPDEPVNMQQVIETKMQEWGDLIESRGINIEVDCEKVIVNFHHQLADILFSNLLNNALRYTPKSGRIYVQLKDGALRVSNTAMADSLDAQKVFLRFYKTQNGTEGTGLGLAIIKEICILAGFTVNYGFEGGNHVFAIDFTNKTV